jgi:pyruvate oxidase
MTWKKHYILKSFSIWRRRNETNMSKWLCTVCGYMYDEYTGEPATGTKPGTRFADLPSDWLCPVCGAPKDAFTRIPDSDEHVGAATTVSEVIISELEHWGVSLVFGLPGTSSLGIIDAIRKNGALRFIVVRHEETAAMAASAYYKLTGKIAACVTIAGPGATNLATGLYDAKEDHAAVLSLNGQVKTQYTGPGGFQEIDQDAFFRPVTVFNNTIYEKKMTLKLLTSALKHALVYRGVAQLSVPNDIQKEPLDPHSCIREAEPPYFNILPEDDAFRRAADTINRAKKPVILAGWGSRDVPEMILGISRRIQAPILTTFRAKGIIPDDNPWLLGILGTIGSAHSRAVVRDCDLLITLGVGFSKMTGVPTDKPLVQVDFDPVKLGKNPSSVSLFGNCNLVLPELFPLLQEKEPGTVLADIARMKGEWDAQRNREADPDAVPIRPPYIIKVLEESIPEDAVICIDVGENGWWFGRNFHMKRQKMVMSGYLATMGFGLPGSIAAQLAYPDKSVICITGDGGFAMAMADFMTAVKYNLPIIVVILNNHQLGMIQVEQMEENYPNFGTDLVNTDFASYGEKCGGAGIPVTKPAELRPAIDRALRMKKPVILDIETDPKRFR